MKEGSGTTRGPTPRGWLRALLRVPTLLYRVHTGWLLGHRFLLLTHVGRKSRTRHRNGLGGRLLRQHDSHLHCCIRLG